MQDKYRLYSKYSFSDKLALALACVAGIMAIVLFLIEKTPTTIVGLLVVMVGMAIYPIIHLLQRNVWRFVTMVVALIGTLALGVYVWPRHEARGVSPFGNSTVSSGRGDTGTDGSPAVQPIPAANRPKNPSNNVVTIPKREAAKQKSALPTPSSVISQSNSGGINVQQATSGKDSPIVNSPITVNPDVNPNEIVVTYDFDGFKRIGGPGLNGGDDGETITFEELNKRYRADDWKGLLELADKEKTKAPEWLTPYYMSASAHQFLCQKEQAIADYEYFVGKGKGSLTYKPYFDPAQRALGALKSGQMPENCR